MIRRAALVLLALSACAPVPLEQAERDCARQIQTNGVAQDSVTFGAGTGGGWMGTGGGGLTIGVGGGGFYDDGWSGNSVGVGLSTTIPTGGPPDLEAAYRRCVQQRAGATATRTLASQL